MGTDEYNKPYFKTSTTMVHLNFNTSCFLFRLTICQSIALAAMCSIATEWSCRLKHTNQWFPVALLSLNTAFGVLLNSKMHCFIQQVNSQHLGPCLMKMVIGEICDLGNSHATFVLV